MDPEGIICSIQDAKTHMVGLYFLVKDKESHADNSIYFHWTSSTTSGRETQCAAVIVTEVKWFYCISVSRVAAPGVAHHMRMYIVSWEIPRHK